jgi:hypothetical protein
MAESGSATVRDLVAENFGIVVAYVVPGGVALLAGMYASPGLKGWVSQAAGEATTFGGFLILVTVALGLGMIVQAARFFFFERFLTWRRLPGSSRIKDRYPDLFRERASHSTRREPEVRAAFRELSEAHYRFYQCHGGLFIAGPAAFVSWWYWRPSSAGVVKLAVVGALLLLAEVALFEAALDALKRNRERERDILTAAPATKEAA